MPTTRPGYIWSGTEWVAIGQEAVLAPVSYQATAPTSPATGDIWIDSDDDVPSIDSSVFYRWKKTAVGGETTLSGADDASLLLKYTVGYEELYINGVLQVRGSDYVATTGTTITGLTALVAGDIVTIMSQVAYALADTYTQTAADAKFQTQLGYQILAWASIKANSVPPVIRSSSNIASFTRTSTGNYTATFSSAVANNNYSVIVSVDGGLDANRYAGVVYDSETTTGFGILSGYQTTSGSIVAADIGRINFTVMGNK